jgi:hypothetical protein
MPASIDAYRQASNTFPSTYVVPTGGSGVWTPSGDSSHAVAFSYFMYLLEGERHLLQATLELSTNCVHQGNGNEFAGCPTFLYNNVAPWETTFSIPNTQYSGLGGVKNSSNPRMTGWAMNLFGQAYAVVPDSDVQSGFIKFLSNANGQYLADNLPYFPSDQAALGSWVNAKAFRLIDSPWMQNINCQGIFMNWRLTESANALAFLQAVSGNAPLIQWANGQPYSSTQYRNALVVNPDTTFNGPFLTPTTWLQVSGAHSSAGNIITADAAACIPANGQTFYFLGVDSDAGNANVPTGVAVNTLYYMVNCSGQTFQVAATLGGSPIAISNVTNISLGAVWNQALTPAQNPPQLPQADDYSGISRAALVGAYLASVTGATLTVLNAAQTWMAPVDASSPSLTWVTWRWVAP